MIIGKKREYSDYSPHKVVNILANQVKFFFKKRGQQYLLSPSKVQVQEIKAKRDNKKGYINTTLYNFNHSILRYYRFNMDIPVSIIFALVCSIALVGHGSDGNFVNIPPPPSNTVTEFERAENPNYFRHAGVVTSISAYAHMSMTIDFGKLNLTVGKTCNCTWAVIGALALDKSLSNNTKLIIKRWVRSSNRICTAMHAEVWDLRNVFKEVDSGINLHKESYIQRQERLRHGRSTNGTALDEHQREPRAAGAIIGGILGAIGGYSLASIFGTDFDDSDIWEELKLQQVADQEIYKHIKWDRNLVEERHYQDFVQEKVEMYNWMMTICEEGITTMAAELRTIFTCGDSLVSGQLGVGMIRPDIIKGKLEAIDAEANRRRQNIAIRSIHEVYWLPVSIVGTQQETVTFAIHIPLFELRNQLALCEYIPMLAHIGTNASVGA